MATTPSDAEFATWLTPAAALERLPSDWSLRTKREAIMSRIQDGSLVALARSVSVQNRGEATKHYGKTAITPDLWCEPFRCRDKAFWTTGDLTFDDEPPMDVLVRWDAEPGDDEAHRIITFKDMRIEPGSFAREFANHLPPAPPSFGPSSERKVPPPPDTIPAAEFAAWLTPKAALAAVPNHIDEAERRPWIMRRLLTGRIAAAAESMRVDGNEGPMEADHPLIERRYWEKWRELGDWFASGDLEVTDAPEVNSEGKAISLTGWNYDASSYRITRYSVAKFLGVRLDPAAFSAQPAKTIYLPPAPSPEEFEQWWFPCHAVDSFLPLGDDQAREAVRSLLTAGAIRAAAEKLILDDQVLGLSGIPKEVWPAVRDERFWSTDFFKIQFGRTSLTAFGVKLDPDAICEHAPPRPPPRPPLPPMSIAEMMKGLDALAGSPASDAPAPAPTRAPSVKSGRGPSDDEILAKADEMRKRGLRTYDLAKAMRLEPGFENVATRVVRDLIKGRYRRAGRAGIKE